MWGQTFTVSGRVTDVATGEYILGANVLDVAPTILAILGIPISEDMAGRVWTEALNEDFLARFPVETIPSHEDPRPGKAGPVEGIMDDEALEERMERLRALGYVEDDAEPASK